VSAGSHYGREYTVTNTHPTLYKGTVGDIPAESSTPDKGYRFGLFTYPASAASFGGQKFTLVNYWIE